MRSDPSRSAEAVPFWRRVWTTADPVMVDAGAGGELLVARVRLAMTATLILIPLANLAVAPSESENYVGVGIASLALAVALVLFHLARRELYRPWVGFLTSALDVSLVSLGLATFLFIGQPHTAVNSKVLFEVYFLAIFGTSLRYDARVCIVTGALAVAEYAAIALAAGLGRDLNAAHYAPFPYGMFSWSAQGARILILAVAGVLSTFIVLRTQRLRQLSTSDRLTRLFNRGYFDARFAAELSRASRTGHPLTIAMLDVDHFKRFNDEYGHTAGDAALRAIAHLLQHALRRSDIVARYGGEEFVLVFPETMPEAVVEKLDALRAAIVQAKIRIPGRQSVTGLTVSAGVAGFPHDADANDELLEIADRRLFEAKAAGRNRVVGPTSVALADDPC